ncbi:molybdopterin-dependent oxidoreductase [Massilia sp. R2A-15]|uniref:molybdopterin-dependent oxidoreductase n=1 Tax=Massilia sp. R2A-15 TaxID=3064278 RepID=UPI0027327429|nr:molybdopterin-dependent oxidoreductase [Massilia sp. R2A-15]WLI88989.1 molybdopterin-dependent oxidoreductase [Massilia sp. R2A-15]
MNKRQFLGAAALAGAAPAFAAPGAAPAFAAPGAAPSGPALLTVTGNIDRTNRGPFDPALDQMMHKQKISFERAFAFDYAALERLPAATVRPTLEYDGKVHSLRGPLLLDVLAAAGARLPDTARLVLRAVDGYAVTISVEKARRQRFMVALQLDGKPMPLGGLGPLWAVIDADRVAELASKPVEQRFGECPWALYHIEVQ